MSLDGERLFREAVSKSAPPPPDDPESGWDDDDRPEIGPSPLLECAVVTLAITAFWVGKLAVWTVAFTVTAVIHIASGWGGETSSRPADIAESFAVGAFATLLLYREMARRLGWRD